MTPTTRSFVEASIRMPGSRELRVIRSGDGEDATILLSLAWPDSPSLPLSPQTIAFDAALIPDVLRALEQLTTGEATE